tara:strand:+ start:22199 stop:22747 length:549 start_codon:yes stop_codon:yes gene_type:complete
MSGIIKATNLEVTTIKDKTNSNTAISIDTSGRVNIPKVPAFAVRGFGSIRDSETVNGVSVSGSGTDIIYNYTTIDLNRDNAFDNSTGIYTVPVAGLYQIQAGFGYKSSGNYMSISIYATSSDAAAHGFIKTWANNDNNHTGRQLATIVSASVGQEFAMGMSDQFSTPSSGAHYCWFSAYMVG